MTPMPRRTVAPASAEATDFTRPLLLGYLQRQLLATDDQIDEIKRLFVRFATTEGYSMGSTYVEQASRWPAAFEALIEAVNRYQVTAVVVPSLLHLAALDASSGFRTRFEDATGAHVLVADVLTSGLGDAAHGRPPTTPS